MLMEQTSCIMTLQLRCFMKKMELLKKLNAYILPIHMDLKLQDSKKQFLTVPANYV